jgi:hypothetical protein
MPEQERGPELRIAGLVCRQRTANNRKQRAFRVFAMRKHRFWREEYSDEMNIQIEKVKYVFMILA